MSELIVSREGELPIQLEDVTSFAAIAQEKLKSAKAEISAIKRLGMTQANEVLIRQKDPIMPAGLGRRRIITNDFTQKLAFSLGEKESFDMKLLKRAIVGCVDVIKTDAEHDRRGVDYIATLRKGAQILIDAKTRERGASRWWKDGEPELALEKWSVVPDFRQRGKAGWTLKEDNPVDMILFTFDPSDCRVFYLLPFQHLRMAFIHNMNTWQRKYQTKRQNSNGWQSEAVFVPAKAVIDAITMEMRGLVA